MAYSISTLSVRKGEVVKADKIQFMIDYIRKLKNRIDSLSVEVDGNSSDLSSVWDEMSDLWAEIRRVRNSVPKIPTKATIIDIEGSPSTRVPSGGTWMVDVHVLCRPEANSDEAFYCGHYATVASGGTVISSLITGIKWPHKHCEGFMWKIAD